MEKIYQVFVEKNDYVERVIPCVSMEVAKRVGLMVRRMKESIKWGKKVEKVLK